MKNQILSKLYFGGVSFCLIAFTTLAAVAQTQQLPLSTYLDHLAPNAALGWSDPVSGNLVIFDAYGKRNTLFGLNLGTTVDGNVTVTFRRDTQSVAVNIRTNNALCYGFDASNDPAFGYRAAELLAGAGPAATGSGVTRIVYAPQPIGPIDFDAPQDVSMTAINCNGALRSGSGYPDGTPGFAQTTQTGLFATNAPGGCPLEHDADCFPAEKVQFIKVGN